MSRPATSLSKAEAYALDLVLAAAERGEDIAQFTATSEYTAARAKVRKRSLMAPGDVAFEDAQLWHEVGGCSLMRSAKLASSYHRMQWTGLYERLRKFYGYKTGRRPQEQAA